MLLVFFVSYCIRIFISHFAFRFFVPDAAGTPCVGAHSVVRALYRAYHGPLYLVSRGSDFASVTIDTTTAGGVADAEAQDAFCAGVGVECTIVKIFDQSPKGNHLYAGQVRSSEVK